MGFLQGGADDAARKRLFCFVARLIEGEATTDLATKYSTDTRSYGLDALTDRSRRTVRYASQLPAQIEAPIV